MSKILALQVDPLPSLKMETDTSIALSLEGQKRGYKVFTYQPNGLSYKAGQVYAKGRYAELSDNTFKILEETEISLNTASVVLMRQDPPFNMDYINATYFLDLLPKTTKVINNPKAVRDWPEKIIPLRFEKYMPKTIITRSVDDIVSFLETTKDIVVKPLYLYGGKGVFRFKNKENLLSLIEFMELTLNEPIIAQEYLPQVNESDKRVIIIKGETVGAMVRSPASGEIRSNMRVGGTPLATTLTPQETEVCNEVGKFLLENDIFLAGLDLIGGYLTEVNITSPTGIKAINKLNNIKLHEVFWDKLETI